MMKRVIAIRNSTANDSNTTGGNNKISLSPSDLETVTDKYATSSPLTLMRVMGFFVISFMLFSVLFSLSVVLRDPPSDAAFREQPSSLFQLQQTQQGFFFFFFSFFNSILPTSLINNILVDRISIDGHYKNVNA